ncbi:hypothetical protein HID58_028038 [Brassica napus]|uniref:non-specific serine/threonine protein kinase n=1 Tax=Brassica napus TaxID=3708 RepID=A0ABQ8CUV2_BRANA|nr:hypothetical protein HID58_028038 [Brassica napus]
MERYDIVKDIGSGNFGVAKLVRDKFSKELFAVKFIERGQKQICHRDLKLENTLLDGSAAPRVKICDFGYSKSGVLHSQPKTTVGTPAYIAPEVLSAKSLMFVTLYVMLVGAYPFEDPSDPKDFRKTMGRILRAHYSVPDYVSDECKHLLSRIFIANPEKRITMEEIKNHYWFLKNLPVMSERSPRMNDQPSQTEEEIVWIIQEARKPIAGASGLSGAGGSGGSSSGAVGSSMDLDDLDIDYDDIDTGDFVL